MTFKKKLTLLVLLIFSTLSFIVFFVIRGPLKNKSQIALSASSFNDLQAIVNIRLNHKKMINKAMDYFISEKEAEEKKFKEFVVTVKKALQDWAKAEEESQKSGLSHTINHPEKAFVAERKFNAGVEMLLIASEIIKGGEKEEAFKLIQESKPLLEYMFSEEVDEIMNEEIEEIQEIYNVLLVNFGAIPWVAGESRKQMEIAHNVIQEYLFFNRLYSSINRQMMEVTDYLIFNEDQNKTRAEEYEIEIRKSLKGLNKMVRKQKDLGAIEIVNKTKTLEEITENYLEIFDLIKIAFLLKEEGKLEKSLKIIEDDINFSVENNLLSRLARAIGQSEKEIAAVHQKLLQATHKANTQMFLGLSILSLVIIFISLKMSRGMINSLSKLREGSEVIGSGRLDYRIELGTKDELDKFAGSFNRMVEELQKTTVSRDYLSNILQSMIDMVVVVSTEGDILSMNSVTSLLLGYSEKELVGEKVEKIFSPDFIEAGMGFKDLIHKEFVRAEEKFYITKDGEKIPISFSSSILRDKDRNILGMICVAKDNRDLKRAQEEKIRLLTKVFASSTEGVIITDIQGNILEVNQAVINITGYSREELIGNNPRILQSGRHNHDFYKKMWSALQDNGQWKGEVWSKRKNGEIFPQWLSLNMVKNEKGEVTTHYVGLCIDLTPVKRAEDHLQFLTNYDPMTKVPNRTLFRERLAQVINQAEEKKQLVAVMFIDINRFKNINDTLGHNVGDQLLLYVARRLSSHIRPHDTLARVSGDKFGIILSAIGNSQDAEIFAKRVISIFARPFNLEGFEVFVTISIGIAFYPPDGHDLDVLMKNVDIAMYFAKGQGKNNFHFYSTDMNSDVRSRLEMETNLRHALDKNEFFLQYQPRVDAYTKEIIGMESLVRWQHSTQGLLSPAKFIPVAEETGLIIPLGEWILFTACRQNKAWQLQDYLPVRVSVNLSSVQFKEKNLIETIRRVLEETKLEPQFLELEITESIFMDNVQETMKILKELKAMGIHLSIDDFGTGYSSLNYLKRFPIDTLKIDQSFVRDITTDPDDATIVSAIIIMAHSLRLKTIAEGVETGEQWEFLKSQKCDEVQGYFFNKPLHVEDFTKLLKKREVR